MTAAIVLAAGASTRLGEPKQLVRLGGETLLERAVRTAREAGCAPVVVVLGGAADEIRSSCGLGGTVVVVNESWAEGMGSSIRLGVASLDEADGVILMTCDQPAVTAAHLRALMGGGGVTASAYAGRRGVPAYFPASAFAGLRELRGGRGAREMLQAVGAIDLANGEVDVDTTEDLARAEQLLG